MVDNELTKMLRDCLATSSQTLHLEWGHPGHWDKCPYASCHGDYALTRPGARIGEPADESPRRTS